VHAGEPFFFPIIFGVLAWLGLLLRDARIRSLLPLRRIWPRRSLDLWQRGLLNSRACILLPLPRVDRAQCAWCDGRARSCCSAGRFLTSCGTPPWAQDCLPTAPSCLRERAADAPTCSRFWRTSIRSRRSRRRFLMLVPFLGIRLNVCVNLRVDSVLSRSFGASAAASAAAPLPFVFLSDSFRLILLLKTVIR